MHGRLVHGSAKINVTMRSISLLPDDELSKQTKRQLLRAVNVDCNDRMDVNAFNLKQMQDETARGLTNLKRDLQTGSIQDMEKTIVYTKGKINSFPEWESNLDSRMLLWIVETGDVERVIAASKYYHLRDFRSSKDILESVPSREVFRALLLNLKLEGVECKSLETISIDAMTSFVRTSTSKICWMLDELVSWMSASTEIQLTQVRSILCSYAWVYKDGLIHKAAMRCNTVDVFDALMRFIKFVGTDPTKESRRDKFQYLIEVAARAPDTCLFAELWGSDPVTLFDAPIFGTLNAQDINPRILASLLRQDWYLEMQSHRAFGLFTLDNYKSEWLMLTLVLQGVDVARLLRRLRQSFPLHFTDSERLEQDKTVELVTRHRDQILHALNSVLPIKDLRGLVLEYLF